MFVVGIVTLFHGHCCFMYCMMWIATYFVCTTASYMMYLWYKQMYVCLTYDYWCYICISYAVYCLCYGYCNFVPWVLLLYMLHAVYCHIFCTLWHCCFTYCIPCTVNVLVLCSYISDLIIIMI